MFLRLLETSITTQNLWQLEYNSGDSSYLVRSFLGAPSLRNQPLCSDSGRFFQINVGISGRSPEKSSLNYELNGSCPVQIDCVEAEIRNLKEDLHTKIFPILFNGKSRRPIVHHLRYVHVVYSRCCISGKAGWI